MLGDDLSVLQAEAISFRGSAFASTTQKTYRSQLKRYLNFCKTFGVQPVPASQGTLTAYMAFLARSLSSSSIPGYMNIVRLMHLDAGFANPLDGNWELKMVYKGISRLLGVPPKQKSPMTPTILLLLHRSLDDSNLDHAFWCACLLAFFGFLRKATLLPASGDLVRGKYIARGDIENLNLTSFLLLVKGSKTIQFGQKVHSVPYAACPDSRLCPVRALLKHWGRSPLPLASPNFNYLLNGVEIQLTHATFKV